MPKKKGSFHGITGITKDFPKDQDRAPNAFNDNEMSKEVLMPRTPSEGTYSAGEPRGREPKTR